MSGHAAKRIIVINLQYGASFSGPGNDVFRFDRAIGEAAEAHNSNFLHPCFYYYENLPTGKEIAVTTVGGGGILRLNRPLSFQ